LGVETDVSHMHLGAVAVFEGPPPSYSELSALVAGKLPALARYRQRVRFVPLDLGRPLWVTDPRFELGYHLRHTALPHPGRDAQLRRLVARVMALPLDRARPLWEMWLIDGLADDRWGALCKLHHCMVDGVAAAELLAALLDLEPSESEPLDDRWLPAPSPSTAQLLAHTLRSEALDPLRHARTVDELIRHPRSLARAATTLAGGMFSMRRRAGQSTARSLNRPLSRHREWAPARAPLADVKTIKNAFGATVNDVVLACVAGAFRELLASRGQTLTPKLTVRTLVPVSVRTPDARGVPDNRVTALIAELSVGLQDPVARLHAITTQLNARKRSGQALATTRLTQLAALCPTPLLSLGTRAFARALQRHIQTVTTNVPGPQYPLYLCQRRMLEIFPYVPLALDVALGIAVCSYDASLTFGITGDGDLGRDVEILADGIQHALDELRARAQPQPTEQPIRAISPIPRRYANNSPLTIPSSRSSG